MDNRHNGFFFSLRFRIIFFFGLLFIILMIVTKLVEFYGLPFTVFKGEYDAHTREVSKKLGLVADLKKERLERWLKERKDDIKVLSESVLIKNYVAALIDTTRSDAAHGKTDNELWQAVQKGALYQDLVNHLKLVKIAHGVYYVLKIVNKESGIIIASTDSKDLGKFVMQEEAISRIINLGDTYVTLDKDPHLMGKFALVISHSIGITQSHRNDKKKVAAVMIAYVDPEDFIRPMLHSGGGLGKSGEALLVNQDRKVLVALKHPLRDGTRAVPLEYEITAKPAVLAARGEEGVIISDDYRGVPVLAAFRHIHVSPQMEWGIVVKCDIEEVFAFLRRSRNYTSAVGYSCILIGLLFIGLIAARLTRPIESIAQAARQVEADDFTARVEVSSRDEIGFLAKSFNSMIGRIQNWKSELERQVKNRTTELSAVNQQLQASEQQLMAANQQLKASQQQLMAANQQLRANEKQLRAEMAERAKIEEKTKKNLHELQVFYKASVGREERIIELKKKIKALEEKLAGRG